MRGYICSTTASDAKVGWRAPPVFFATYQNRLAGLDRANAFGRARQDEVTRLQRKDFADVLDVERVRCWIWMRRCGHEVVEVWSKGVSRFGAKPFSLR